MKIHENFMGGNIRVMKKEGDTIELDNNLRDTIHDWFYWAFCVEGAAGRTLTFQFRDTRLGYFGPAVSHDLKDWNWLMEKDEDSFTYTFQENEDKVYFAHHILYHPIRFQKFVQENGVEVKTLTMSRKGRKIPCIEIGKCNKKIVLTARHHACESTGSYILEGILEEWINNPIEGYSVFCVPFMDYDGVVEGDQGKGRFPHDHNRDYEKDREAIYPSVAMVRKYVAEENVIFGFDFHAPYHCGGVRDTCFIVQKRKEELEKLNRFGEIFESSMTETAFQYYHKNDYPPDYGWNKSSAQTFASWALNQKNCQLAFTLETAYFGTESNIFTAQKGVETGRCFARALKQYITSDQQI